MGRAGRSSPASIALTPGPTPTGQLGHRLALDGVRGVAVALVVVFHAWGWPRGGGELGVEVFFVLSGFLITTLLLEEHDARGGIDLRSFFARRVLRLLPVLYVVLLATVAVVAVAGGPDRRWYLESVVAVTLYVGNLFPFVSDRFDLAPALGHLWSLGVEEQFYVAWPFVVVALVAVLRGRRAALAVVLGLGVAGAVVLRALIQAFVTDADFSLPTTYLDALLAGAFVAALRRVRHLPLPTWPAVLLLGLGCVAPVIDRTWAAGAGLLWLVAIGVALVVAALGGARWLAWSPLVGLGTISYGLYVVHVPLLVAAEALAPKLQHDVRAGMAVALAVAVAVLSRRTLEAWFLARKPERAGEAADVRPA